MQKHSMHRKSSGWWRLANLNLFICTFMLVPIFGLTVGHAQELLLRNQSTDEVLAFNGTSGAFISAFVSAGSGGLDRPDDLAFGPDGNLYVTSTNTGQVLRYNGTTGSFIDVFVAAGSGGLDSPSNMVFGPDGNLYVENLISDQVLRYDGNTGAFIDVFIAGISTIFDMVFGPDGNLYISNGFFATNKVSRYDGVSGAFIDTFIPYPGINYAFNGLLFDSDGNLLVSSQREDQVRRYNGSTGAFIDVFVSPGNGLSSPTGMVYGPDSNLYVSSFFSNQVLRYDATSGAFIDVFVAAGSGGLSFPNKLLFSVPPLCSSEVTTIAGLMAEVDALTTSVQTVNTLNNTLSNAETALGNENNTTARGRMENFISKVVNRSNYKESNKNRILLDEANSLICGGSNVLIGIPLE